MEMSAAWWERQKDEQQRLVITSALPLWGQLRLDWSVLL